MNLEPAIKHYVYDVQVKDSIHVDDCDFCGASDSPLVQCGNHYHFLCPACIAKINKENAN